MMQDAHALEDMKNSVDELVPQLEKEYADLMQQLEQEQAEVAEIESGDQEYLNDLKATIAEQKYVSQVLMHLFKSYYTSVALRLRHSKPNSRMERTSCDGCKRSRKRLRLRSGRLEARLTLHSGLCT